MELKRPIYVFCALIFLVLSCDSERLLPMEGTPDSPEEIGLSVVVPENSPFGINGRLKVIGTQLSNQQNKAIQLRGMSTHGLQYRGNCYTDASLNLLFHGWKADILRISMYIQEGGYEEDPEYFTNFVDSLVNICYENGVYALIDWHMLDPGDPNYNTELAEVFFEHVSQEHADKGNVIYEICNEPNDGNNPVPVTWPMIKNYANQIIPIIRANDPESVIVVGTPENASRPDLVVGDALSYDNIMYTMHFYAADNWQSQHQERRKGYVSTAIENGIPVFVTEFGTQDGWGNGANDFVTSTRWLRFLAERKISWCNWNYSDSPLTGASWVEGTCPDGPWTDVNLKEAGLWIRNWFTNPVADWSGNFPTFAYDLGTGSGTLAPTSSTQISESGNGTTGFLPVPSSGVARVELSANAGFGAEFDASELTLGTSSLDAPNKFSLYDITEYTSLAHISFKLNFNNTVLGTTILGIGSAEGDLFNSSDPYVNASGQNISHEGLFTAIRFAVGTSGTNPTHRNADLTHTNYDDAATLFPRDGALAFEFFCNNTSVPKSYERSGTSYTLPAKSLHLFVNGTQVTISGNADLPSSTEITPYEPLNALVLMNYRNPWVTGTPALETSISDIQIKSLIGN